ncbi:RHS repeat-associated core domain-containing protein [Pseudomonas guariconensis]|uniref:RHS repeat-associated core domain-containing protein n=1 Tax=Pseudomonas guariconensis TaxID=1288410 RepID=UPI0018AB3393|nr:RHS repeat domain-containing protein [Pseudomonas guariconensis]MBF8749121.1 RHS repeat protein [Pseudomonas guariconensis]
MNLALFNHTPMIKVLDNRGLIVCDIEFHRHPYSPSVTDRRLTHHQYDTRGFLVQSADPRLHACGLANFTYQMDLAGTALHTRSVDAGISITLNDAAGRPFMEISQVGIDREGNEERSQAVTRTWQYEAPALAGRPLSVTEQVAGGISRVTERFVWAGLTQEVKQHNLAGQAVSHYDLAGLVKTNSITLNGVPSSVSRQLLKDAENPDIATDWQGEETADWNTRLADRTYTTQTTADAAGAVLTTLDAMGNLQRMVYDVAGQLSGSWLTPKGTVEQVIVKSLSYAATGQKLREEHGNGVVTTYTYEPMTQRLASIKTERPTGHASGAKVLQDLRYAYDPVGNVLKIRNDAEATRFWRNQKVVPENTYTYDSLYQLISATGREMANADQQGRHLPHVTAFDSATYTPYTRTYTYDTAGNLTQIRHSAPATGNNYTTDITVSDRSNRAVISTLTEAPSAVEALFTPGGQQTVLLPGQPLAWTSRAELEQVVSVKREGSPDDRESYRYDSSSQRVLKASSQQTAGSTRAQRVIYLPGLELRIHANGDTLIQDLQVATVGEAGRAQVRVLHWEAGKPADIPNDQVRYSYDNLLGSSALEVDSVGNLISQEEYYPFGGTAVWAARNEVEACYKTVRYSGKERDATGLYYYGYRYYQPWAGRWLSADPAGTVDGLNVFRMVGNNPLTLIDEQGLMRRSPSSDTQQGPVPSTHAQQPSVAEPSASWVERATNYLFGTQPSEPDDSRQEDIVEFIPKYNKEGAPAMVTHGSPDGMLLDYLGEPMEPGKFAREVIKPHLDHAMKNKGTSASEPLFLMACFSGSSGAAQKVANELRRPVIAPRGQVRVEAFNRVVGDMQQGKGVKNLYSNWRTLPENLKVRLKPGEKGYVDVVMDIRFPQTEAEIEAEKIEEQVNNGRRSGSRIQYV